MKWRLALLGHTEYSENPILMGPYQALNDTLTIANRQKKC